MRSFLLCGVLWLSLAPLVAASATGLPAAAPLSASEQEQLDRLVAPATIDTPGAPLPGARDLLFRLSASGSYFGLPFGAGGDLIRDGYAALSRGDVEAVLAILDQGEQEAGRWSALPVFRILGLRADVLMRSNRGLETGAVLERAAALESGLWQRTWISQARRGESLAWRAARAEAQGDLARVALQLGDWQLPLEFDEMPDVRDLIFRTEAKIRSHMGLASLHARTADAARALAWANSAERHYARLFALAAGPHGAMVPMLPDFYIGRAENLAYLGVGLIGLRRDATAAEPYFDAARAFFKAIDYPFGEALVLALKAQALQAAGLEAAFLELAPEAARHAASLGLGELVWPIELQRGRLLQRSGQLEQAERALRHAQQAVEQVSGQLSTDRAKLDFGIGKEAITAQLVDIDLARKDLAALFRDLERGRARAFVDMLAGQQLAAGREADAVAALLRLKQQIQQQRLARVSPGADGARARQAEDELLRSWREHIAQLQQRDPDLAAMVAIDALELSDIQARLATGETLAYALPGPDDAGLRLLMISRAGAEAITLSASLREIRRGVAAFRRAVDDADAARQKKLADALGGQLELVRWGARRALHVVPAGALHFMPWGALPLEVPVAVLPNGGWLARSGRPLLNPRAAAVVGDPDFHGRLPQLPAARREAQQVAAAYSVTPLSGSAATETALREAVGSGVAVLHLATHGQFDMDQPLQSAVVLAGDAEPDFLSAARLFEAPLAARLVVLSACETGAGRALAGEDFLGLVRSFYLGGALTVVNSLWPIEDEGTALFMERFHALARQGRYGEAWLAARNQLRQRGSPPSIYGAFVLGGALRAEP